MALIVVLSHLSVLTQLREFDGLNSLFDASFAVKGFFAISGFLVMKSYFSSPTLLDFAEKRFRRIYPAYITAVLLCVVIGVFATSLSAVEFFRSSQTFKYIFANAIFLNFLQPTLPMTFDQNFLHAMNGSLWTIKVEVSLYFCIPLIFFLFRKFGSGKTAVALAAISVVWALYFTYRYSGRQGVEIARQFPGQLSYFVLGALFAANKQVLRHVGKVAAISLISLILLSDDYARFFIEPVCYSSLVVFLSTGAVKDLNFGKFGDISYGIYLYHFPVIQALILTGVFELSAWVGLALAFVITISVALTSWHFIEKRFLKRTSHYLVAAKA